MIVATAQVGCCLSDIENFFLSNLLLNSIHFYLPRQVLLLFFLPTNLSRLLFLWCAGYLFCGLSAFLCWHRGADGHGFRQVVGFMARCRHHFAYLHNDTLADTHDEGRVHSALCHEEDIQKRQ